MDLSRFGFTSTESRVYLALLRVSPATGYAVAREAKLARANTYAALERLRTRGAATRLPGRPARYVAADPSSVTGRLARDWKRDLESLSATLAAAASTDVPHRREAHEPILDRPSLLQQLVACSHTTRDELLAVVGPWVVEFYGELARVRSAGAHVRVLSLGSPAPPGALVREVPRPEISSYWGGFPVALVTDRLVAVLGLVSEGNGATGVVTDHPAEVPFIRHLLRRELASTGSQRVS